MSAQAFHVIGDGEHAYLAMSARVAYAFMTVGRGQTFMTQARGANAELDATLNALYLLALAHQRAPGVTSNATAKARETQQTSGYEDGLDVPAAAARLQVKPPAIRAAIKRKRLPANKIHGHWVIYPADLEMYRKDRRHGIS